MTALYAIRSLVAYLVIVLYILLVSPVALLFGKVLRWKRGMYALGRFGVGMALRLTGIGYRVTYADGRSKRTGPTSEGPALSDGPEADGPGVGLVLSNGPGAGPGVVFCANHESNVDPAVLFLALHPQLHVLYKAELRNVPMMGMVFDVGGFVAVHRGERERSMASIAEGARSVQAGNCFLIFPEGTRSRTGDLLPFKKGGFIMAIQAQAPIVPVAIHGGRAAMRKGSPIVRPVQVAVRVGTPIPTTGLTLDDRDALIGQVRTAVQALLTEIPNP